MGHFGDPGWAAKPASNFLKIEIFYPQTLYFDALNPLVIRAEGSGMGSTGWRILRCLTYSLQYGLTNF